MSKPETRSPCHWKELEASYARQPCFDSQIDLQMSVGARDRPRVPDRQAGVFEALAGDQVPPADRPIAPSHLVHIFPSFGLGGVPIRIATIINELGGRYRHTIIALDGCLDSRTRIDPSVNVTFKSFQDIDNFDVLCDLKIRSDFDSFLKKTWPLRF